MSRFGIRERAFSLRVKYALLVNLFILAPMTFHFVRDGELRREEILEARLEVLRSMGRLVVEHVVAEGSSGDAGTWDWLTRFGEEQEELEIYLLNEDFRIVASSLPERVGDRLPEATNRQIIEEGAGFTWALGTHRSLPVLEISLPVVPEGREHPSGVVHIAEPQALLEEQIREARIRDAVFLVGLMVLMSTLVTVTTDRLVIRRLTRLTDRLRETEWLTQEDDQGGNRDEVAVLAEVLESLIRAIDSATADLRNALSEKEALVKRVEGFNEELTVQVQAAREELEAMQEELLRKERLSVVGELAAGLAHEIRNPLQIIRGTAEMVRRRNPSHADALADVVEEVDRLNTLVRELLDYARPLEVEPRPVGVAALVQGAVDEVGRPVVQEGEPISTDDDEAAGNEPAMEVSVEPGTECQGDETLLRRVLVNLLTNALEASPPGAERVRILARTEPGGACRIEVWDHGVGISEEDLERVFTPFFSRKEAGIGLGLSLSRRIVEEHAGELEIHTEPGKGTCVCIRFPVREEAT